MSCHFVTIVTSLPCPVWMAWSKSIPALRRRQHWRGCRVGLNIGFSTGWFMGNIWWFMDVYPLVNVYSLRTRTSPSFRSVNQRTFYGPWLPVRKVLEGLPIYGTFGKTWGSRMIPRILGSQLSGENRWRGCPNDVANCDKIYPRSHGLLHVPKGEPPFSFSILGLMNNYSEPGKYPFFLPPFMFPVTTLFSIPWFIMTLSGHRGSAPFWLPILSETWDFGGSLETQWDPLGFYHQPQIFFMLLVGGWVQHYPWFPEHPWFCFFHMYHQDFLDLGSVGGNENL